MKKICLVLLTLFFLCGCGSNDDDDNNGFVLEDSFTLTWSADGKEQMQAITKNGAISVTAVRENTITADITRSCRGEDETDAEAHINDIEIQTSETPGSITLRADMPDGGNRAYRADFEITSPHDVFFNLTALNGALLVSKMRAGAKMRTTNGAIAIINHYGNIDATTVNGEISCDVALLEPDQSVVLNSTNGNIELGLPEDVSAAFSARTVNGNVTISGFGNVTYTVNEGNYKSGTLGSGDAEISIMLVNGNIRIHVR